MLNKLLGRGRSQAIVGVDLSSHSIKVLELGRGGSGYSLEGYSIMPLPPNCVVEKNVVEVERVAELLQAAMTRARCKLSNAAVAVSGSVVITKVVEMPAGLREEDMETQIGLEADQYIPYPLEEVALDFDVLGVSAKNAEMVDVLVAACRQESIEQRVEVLELAGLQAKVVDVEAYALERTFHLMAPMYGCDEKSIVAVVDIGSSLTTLSVLQGGETVYTREQAFGGQMLTEEIQRHYGMTAEEAEQLKRDGPHPEDYESEVLVPFRESLIQQVSRALQFFFAASHFNEVDLLLLGGGVAALPGLAPAVAENLQVQTGIANPFAGMTMSGRVDAATLQRDAPALMTACGLALRSFD